MNNQNPLIPQGSLLEQKNKGRARVKLAVFFVLAVHGIGLMALLMQGCRQEKPVSDQPDTTATNPPPPMEATNPPTAMDTNPPPVAATNPPVVPEVAAPVPPPLPPTAADYSVAKGDTLAGIAKKLGVKTQALVDANPGVQPTKLKIGQKLHVPATANAPTAAPAAAAAPGESAAVSEPLYTVKSGDVLYNIAKSHGTTVKALRAANNMKSDRIVVGQKLKIPVKAAASAPAPAAPAESAPSAPAATSTPSPTSPGR
jgi:LysM repeat protein